MIDTQRFSRRMSLSDEERRAFEKELKQAEAEGSEGITASFSELIREIEAALGRALTDEDGTPLAGDQDPKFIAERAVGFQL